MGRRTDTPAIHAATANAMHSPRTPPCADAGAHAARQSRGSRAPRCARARRHSREPSPVRLSASRPARLARMGRLLAATRQDACGRRAASVSSLSAGAAACSCAQALLRSLALIVRVLGCPRHAHRGRAGGRCRWPRRSRATWASTPAGRILDPRTVPQYIDREMGLGSDWGIRVRILDPRTASCVRVGRAMPP